MSPLSVCCGCVNQPRHREFNPVPIHCSFSRLVPTIHATMVGLAWPTTRMRRLNAYAKVVSSENNVRKVLGGRGGDRRFNLNSQVYKNFLLLTQISVV